jgi:hypothetical protein
MMAEEKIYCGSGRIFDTKFGKQMKVSFSKKDINKMVSYMKANNLEWINLVIKEKKDKVEGKPTHYLEVDTYKSDKKKESSNDLPW